MNDTCPPIDSSAAVKATIQFIPRDIIYETEKAYSIQYTPHGDIPRTNVSQETVNNIPMTDMRAHLDDLSLQDNGFIVRQLRTLNTYDDFANPEAVKAVYLEEVLGLLRHELGTKNVAILEYLVRRRHDTFPLSPGNNFDYAQPVPTAHIDFSPDCVSEIIQDRYGERASTISCHHYQVINIWKPLVGPLQDWPLCLCRPDSLDYERDIQLMDRVYPNNVEESIQIHYSPAQRWEFLSDQMDDEVLIFRTGDSELDIKGGVPHCAFQLPASTQKRLARESIEVRALVCYADTDLDMTRVSPSRRHGPKSTFQQGPRFHQDNSALVAVELV